MKKQCAATYSRRSCTPFSLGIEGLKCELEAGHDGDEHVGHYTAAFAEEGGEDHLLEFRFKVVPEEP